MTKSERSVFISNLKKAFPVKEEPPSFIMAGWDGFLKKQDAGAINQAVILMMENPPNTYGKLPSPNDLKPFLESILQKEYAFCPCCCEGWILGDQFRKDEIDYEAVTACDCEKGKSRNRGLKIPYYYQKRVDKCDKKINPFCGGQSGTENSIGSKVFKRENCIAWLEMGGVELNHE